MIWNVPTCSNVSKYQRGIGYWSQIRLNGNRSTQPVQVSSINLDHSRKVQDMVGLFFWGRGVLARLADSLKMKSGSFDMYSWMMVTGPVSVCNITEQFRLNEMLHCSPAQCNKSQSHLWSALCVLEWDNLGTSQMTSTKESWAQAGTAGHRLSVSCQTLGTIDIDPFRASFSLFVSLSLPNRISYSRILRVNWLRNLEWLDATRREFPSHSLRVALPLPWLDGFRLDVLRSLLSNGSFEYHSETFWNILKHFDTCWNILKQPHAKFIPVSMRLSFLTSKLGRTESLAFIAERITCRNHMW